MPDIWLIVATIICVLLLISAGYCAPEFVDRIMRPRYEEPPSALPEEIRALQKDWLAQARADLAKDIMQVVVSLALLGVGLYVILSKQYTSADTNWSYGIVGTVIGFWLKRK